ncbi:hypothetical protein ACD591_08090 [Rufibacter glacialis]|uniref:DUF6980 domain-containing protein n=2 Tax=Rufibacter glacialis TaxID=1259555 RepID=A0ABV4REP7_9BACT|nr:hypothetical protein [Rufibacter glacialis]
MDFETIYNEINQLFPEQLDISDGRFVQGTIGFHSQNLIDAWNAAEEESESTAEGYFIWAMYCLLHQLAKKAFRKGNFTIKTSDLAKEEIKRKYDKVLKEAEPKRRIRSCCRMMASQFNKKCEIHDSAYDCPDVILDRDEKGSQYRILIHDGGTSGISIKFCPWCGKEIKNRC